MNRTPDIRYAGIAVAALSLPGTRAEQAMGNARLREAQPAEEYCGKEDRAEAREV